MSQHRAISHSEGHPPAVPLPSRRPGVGGMRVRWEERLMRWPTPHQLQLEVPVIGWFTGPSFGYLVGVALARQWAPGGLGGRQVSTVVGHLDHRHSRRILVVLVTFDGAAPAGQHPDAAPMARDVIAAVRWAEHAAKIPQDGAAWSASERGPNGPSGRADGRWNATSGPDGGRRTPYS